MDKFWEHIIQPILELVNGAVLEIGAYYGDNTMNLIEHCKKRKKKLEVIDPLPLFDKQDLIDKYKFDFELHEELSLEVLPRLGKMGAVLIDGDHNWFTVYKELKALEKTHPNSKEFPIVLFHDTEWPYARRDLYYNPETIPQEFRHAYSKAGLRFGHEQSLKNFHYNSHLFNAQKEGGAKNGVLTAIEDFIGEYASKCRFVKIPFYHGLGILIPEARLQDNPKLLEFVSSIETAEFQKKVLQECEKVRARSLAEATHKLKLAEMETARLNTELQKSQNVSKKSSILSLKGLLKKS